MFKLKTSHVTIPLFGEFTVFLPVCSAQSEQRLQTVSAGLHILIVYVHVVQILLFLKDLLSCTCHRETDSSSRISQVKQTTRPFFRRICAAAHMQRRRARSLVHWYLQRWRRRTGGTRVQPRQCRGWRCSPGSSSSKLRDKIRKKGALNHIQAYIQGSI